MSVYDELLKMQTLPHAYEAWSEYREVLTGYLLTHTKPHTSAAIFGAGSCNDIDLACFAKHFSSVTLFDSNKAAMENALRRYQLTDNPTVKIIVSDFTGIAADEYRALSDELSSLLNVRGIHTDINILADYALFKLDGIYKKADTAILDFGENSFDYTIAFGVHSQLNNMAAWIWSAFCANLNVQNDTVTKRISRENNILIPRLNDAILRAAKMLAFFGCELKTSTSDSAVEGAIQCIQDIKNRGAVTNQAVIDWPFDVKQGIVYQMLIQECKSK